jgi:hypothetical protein
MNKWLAFFIPGVFLVCLGLTLMFYRLVTNGLSVDFILDIFFSLFLLGQPGRKPAFRQRPVLLNGFPQQPFANR